MKRVTKIIKNETKEQKGGFLGTLLGTLGANLLGNLLPESGMLSAEFGNKEGKGTLRSGFRSSKKKKINSTRFFNKLWNTELLSEWT